MSEREAVVAFLRKHADEFDQPNLTSAKVLIARELRRLARSIDIGEHLITRETVPHRLPDELPKVGKVATPVAPDPLIVFCVQCGGRGVVYPTMSTVLTPSRCPVCRGAGKVRVP